MDRDSPIITIRATRPTNATAMALIRGDAIPDGAYADTLGMVRLNFSPALVPEFGPG